MAFAVLIPGQGSQFRGMGQDVLPKYPGVTQFASDLLGYDLVALCRDDPGGRLADTAYTQPALFVVNALHLFERERREERTADYCLGHSLGEYNALMAAGVLDLETGLRIVRRRAELMAEAVGGGMTAVLNTPEARLAEIFAEDGVEGVDIAAFNTDAQVVVAAPERVLGAAHAALRNRGVRFVPLRVGGAFHSRYMESARREFARFLEGFSFGAPRVRVISNVTARPHEPGRIRERLAEQLVRPVRWTDSIRYLMSRGELEFQEVGGKDLTRMVQHIRTVGA
ncbi:ACP S-malonyltransferase [Streptomyces noursei]|uniref:ACP S-malonyltransferase n=1 Tax=Streptomyces noursei TaxID=1971 RepID=UPI0023B8712C|nr:ACP S-malonyltransferase [Streptomyces noursei]